ncbi:hypothetical protein Poli38472_010121 [Pythium oligandrum]|uniref:Uncharacterized protein n=1 Tax=Pythium oligandrum TaxID=41045 RepID=A0A8K1FGC7_PYTOL|nr:hypothetical protein Poli38472_010121 [Pythium oligandrum]|eukprot:TMW58562.1 hypothetical protein Poli38472_010121 [Pythium oligandrum]
MTLVERLQRLQRLWPGTPRVTSLLQKGAGHGKPSMKPSDARRHGLPLVSPSNSQSSSQDSSKPRKEERLSDAMWKPEQEFPGSTTIDRSRMSITRESQILARVARVAVKSIFKPSRLIVLGTCSLCTLGLTSYEAHLLLDPACSAADALAFTHKYSTENFFASCIWETREAELVAQALGMNPDEVLKVLDPENSPEDAQLSLHLQGIYTTRAIVAGFMVITQVLSIVRESMLATHRYMDHVFLGKEPPLRGITERIIRLAGDGSDVTEVSMARYGAHILPVYENPSKWKHLIAFWSVNGRVPCVWHVASGNYGYRHSWASLEVDSSFMLRTTTGKYILCIEADATNLDRAHELQKPNNDITLEEASQAYRMIERAAARKINRPFRSLCVFLGDSLQLCDTGGTSFVTLRERIHLKKEVDVLIDAKAPLLLAILKWCSRFADKHRTIVLDATPLNYAPLQVLLERNGYTVLTPTEEIDWKPGNTSPPPPVEAPISPGDLKSVASSKPVTASPKPVTASSTVSATPLTGAKNEKLTITAAKSPSETIKDKKEKLPRLIYYPTTAATINAVHSVLTAGLAAPRHCCVLINSPFGLSHLKEIAEYEEEDFYPICAAEIYDDYFRQVRIWTRMGHSAAAIQRELDQRFAPVLGVQTEISHLERASTTMRKT